MCINRTIHQDELIRQLKEIDEDLNVENMFWVLRRLKAEGKIIQLAGGYWRFGHPTDEKTGSLTKWI